jgi:predicted nucleotide-binding protein
METMLESFHEQLEMVKHNNVSQEKISYDPKKVFIVYGHDSNAKWELVRMVEKEFGLEAIVLEEQANMGRTIIEKFENVAELPGYALYF